MQVGVNVTCMHTNFGGHSLSGFEDIVTFKNSQFSLSDHGLYRHLCWLQSIRNLMLMYWVGLDAASHSLFYALLSSAFVVLGLLTTDRFTPSTPLTLPLLKGVCQLNCFCSVSCLCFLFSMSSFLFGFLVYLVSI